MNRLFAISMVLSLLLCSCGEEGKTSYTPLPAVKTRILHTGFTEAEVEVKSINAERTMYLSLEKGGSGNIEAGDVAGTGLEVPAERFMIEGLADNTEYHLLVTAIGKDGTLSAMGRDTLYTPNDPSNDKHEDVPIDKEQDENGMYWWERSLWFCIPEPTPCMNLLCQKPTPTRNSITNSADSL